MKISKIYNYAYILIGIPWLFLMIITSRGFTGIKTAFLVTLFGIALSEMIFCRLKMTKNHLLYLVIFITYFFLNLLWGIYRGFNFDFANDFALIQYYFITPIIVIVFNVVLTNNDKRIKTLWIVIKYITLLTVVMDVWKIFAYKGILPDIDFLN